MSLNTFDERQDTEFRQLSSSEPDFSRSQLAIRRVATTKVTGTVSCECCHLN